MKLVTTSALQHTIDVLATAARHFPRLRGTWQHPKVAHLNELCLAHFLRPALASLILSLVSLRAGAEPQPGDVFSEFTFNEGAKPGTHTSELDPGIKRDFSKNFTWAKDAPRHAPHPLVLDLATAPRAPS